LTLKNVLAGLRTEILLSLILLLVPAMVLTTFIVVRIWERDLLRHKTGEARALIGTMQQAMDDISQGQAGASLKAMKEEIRQRAQWLAPKELFEPMLVVGEDGSLWIGDPQALRSTGLDESALSTALEMKKRDHRVEKKAGLLVVRAPLFAGGRSVAVVQVLVRIDHVLEGLKRSQQLIWFYIGLNVVVLLIFGTFLLSRIVVRPLNRLVKTADHFEESAGFSFVMERENNEIAHLGRSLNRMLRRLEENRERMETQIRSLEQTNEALKEAREVVLRSEKLSSLGRLAAGMAHEVGNPIGSILGYADLLKGAVEKDPKARDYMARIEDEIVRIDTIVRDLLDYSRPSQQEPVPVDVNAAVSEAVSFFSRQKFPVPVEFTTRLQPDAGLVWGSEGRLKQVVINLLFNACDALTEDGRVTVTTARKIGTETAKGGSQPQPGEFVEIAVSDNGMGIAASELKKIFDPFYTTKPPGKGTGLGLPVSLRIVESLGGTIHVESIEGKGTVFSVKLKPWIPDHDA
jgi:hypothetical protein